MLLHEATVGAMRDLDRLAAAALRESARKKRKLVERDVVTRLIEADTRERDRCSPVTRSFSGVNSRTKRLLARDLPSQGGAKSRSHVRNFGVVPTRSHAPC